jgi:HEAT repeat protein
MTWDPSRHEVAGAALRQIGTDAVPYLIEQAFKGPRHSAVRREVYRLINTLPHLLGLSPLVSPEIRSEEAGNALQAIKPPASQLLPLLERHLHSTSGFERRQALFILGTTGDGAEQAVPYLCGALKSPDHWERLLAVQSLGWLGASARTAVPALIEVLKAPQDTSQSPAQLARPAAHALGAIGSAAAPALPLVRALFETETNWNARCGLAAALCHIDPGQTNALAFLTNSLTTHEPASERWIAAGELGNIGPAAKAAVPILLEALDGTNTVLFSQVPGALKKIGVPSEEFLPRMKRQLQSKDPTTRVNAAARVLDINPADHDALVVLMDAIQKRALYQDFAIEALVRAGPPAAEAVPVLRDLARNGQTREREAALRALKRIEAKPEANKAD